MSETAIEPQFFCAEINSQEESSTFVEAMLLARRLN
jgi:hypothetical protein